MKTFKVNLQQGFIIAFGSQIIGVYDHHNKVCIFSQFIPTLELPEEIKGYEQIFGYTDNFSIVCWTSSGYKTPHELLNIFKENQQ